MHREFKAYIEAVCDTAAAVQRSRVSTQLAGGVQPVTARKKNLFAAISHFLSELPPYYCELKMVPGVKCIGGPASRPRDAIGYHGLV